MRCWIRNSNVETICRGHGEVPANGGILARKRLCSCRYERGGSGSPSGKSANAVFIFYFLLSRVCGRFI